MRVALTCLVAVLVVVLPVIAFSQTLEEKVQEFTLENGMKFLVVERHEAPVFFGAIAFKVGSIDERPGIYGVSHLLEHMLFKGTQTVGTKDYKKERPFLEREDALAEEAKRIAFRIEPWRLEYLDRLATGIVAGFSEEDRAVVGTDKALELELLIEQMRKAGPPPELSSVPGLVTEGGTDYFELYLTLKKTQMDLYDTMAAHRELIVNNEFGDIYGANGERMLNAGTSNDATYYMVSLPSNRLELWMLMESDRLANPVFREFYSERDVVTEERRMSENSPNDVMYETFMATAFDVSAYGNPIVGWMSDLQYITRGDLESYYRQHYGPNNAIALLAGDVRLDEVKKLAERYFGPVKRGPESAPLVTSDPPQQGERRVVLKEDAKPSLAIGYHVPKAPHPDSYALDMLAAILSDGRTSRFYRNVHEAQGLTREAPEVWTGPGSRLDPLLSISADPKEPHTLAELEAAIYAEIGRIKNEPPTARELERVVNQREAQLVRSLGSNIGLAFAIGAAEAVRGDWRTVLTDLERLKSVTPGDVSRAAADYLTEENRTVVWLVEKPAEEGAPRGEPDIAELMEWVGTLPPEEQQQLMMQFQSLDQKGRETLVMSLFERMKAAKGTN
jgi:predicted Zn-dependent peptidase